MKVIVVPCSFDNYAYILLCEKSGKAAVVDPAEAYPVMMEVEKAGGELAAILCTHHHTDHVGDIETLLAEMARLPVYCHYSDKHRILGANRLLSEGECFSVGDLQVEVLHTPGHTRGSIVYLIDGALFTGDTLFGAGCGKLFEGTVEDMYASLNRLKKLPDETNIYFGHEYTWQNLKFAKSVEPGNNAISKRLQEMENMSGVGMTTPSTLWLEKATNPFLRCEHLVIPQCRSSFEVFTHLRRLKDTF